MALHPSLDSINPSGVLRMNFEFFQNQSELSFYCMQPRGRNKRTMALIPDDPVYSACLQSTAEFWSISLL